MAKRKLTTGPERFDDMSRDDLLEFVKSQWEAGVRVSFDGKEVARKIARKVQPRCIRAVPTLSIGRPEDQAENLIIEGENLQAMATLFRERGNVDLILTDPPYNTGNDFRYNDKWDDDPNDPDLGDLVPQDDGARHTKWLKFMWPRLSMMKEMLKPTGILAICIDYRELFRLGLMLDELFGEGNRLAIINWEKSYSPKNDKGHVAVATEYVLVYARDEERARTGVIARSEAMDARYRSLDGDARPWKPGGDASAKGSQTHKGMLYGIQSPFTGEIFYPPEGRHWSSDKRFMKEWLEEWGPKYSEKDLKDGRTKALVLDEPLATASRKANRVLKSGLDGKRPWPKLYFGSTGKTGPALKRYLDEVKKGVVPTTYWAEDDYDTPLALGSTSWEHEQSGHSQTGVNELQQIMGRKQEFETVKPMKLFTKIIQLWCPPQGLVLDPFAGSGTTGHATLKLNESSGANRRFILIEQGRPERGDSYARSLTAERIRRAITGKWNIGKREALDGGFQFVALQNKVDARALLGMERDEMADIVIASHFDSARRGAPSLVRISDPEYKYLVAKNHEEEGFFLVWNGQKKPPVLDEKTYEAIAKEAANAGLLATYHVYARFAVFQSDDVRFYQIPDRILMDFGLSVSADAFNNL